MKTSIFFVILNIHCLYSSAFSAKNLVVIKQTNATNSLRPSSLAVDGDESTCFKSKRSIEHIFQISLVQNYLIESVQIVITKDILEIYEKYYPKSQAWVIVSKSEYQSRLCGPAQKFPERFQNFICDPPLEGGIIKIRVASHLTPHELLLCEVKVRGIPISKVADKNATSIDTRNKKVEVKETTMSEVAKSNSTSNDTNDKSPVQIGLEKQFSSVFTPRSFDDKIFTICIYIIVDTILLVTIIQGFVVIYKQ